MAYQYVVRLTPEQYAVVMRLVVHNDVIAQDGKSTYMDLEVKAALANAEIAKVQETPA